jgi:hypothetical protein
MQSIFYLVVTADIDIQLGNEKVVQRWNVRETREHWPVGLVLEYPAL